MHAFTTAFSFLSPTPSWFLSPMISHPQSISFLDVGRLCRSRSILTDSGGHKLVAFDSSVEGSPKPRLPVCVSREAPTTFLLRILPSTPQIRSGPSTRFAWGARICWAGTRASACPRLQSGSSSSSQPGWASHGCPFPSPNASCPYEQHSASRPYERCCACGG